jgi:chemotaxis response regulator CheB
MRLSLPPLSCVFHTPNADSHLTSSRTTFAYQGLLALITFCPETWATFSESESLMAIASPPRAASKEVDGAVRPENVLDFPVVGIGASAGGIQALLRFFEHMPPDAGMAFVLVLHLSPTHESRADEVLQRVTKCRSCKWSSRRG